MSIPVHSYHEGGESAVVDFYLLLFQRAEEEKIRQEELKKQEVELAEKCRKENEERDARKKVRQFSRECLIID